MKIFLIRMILVCLPAAFYACQKENIQKVAPTTARVLFAQASPRIDPTKNVELYTSDITLGNNNRKANLAFGGVAITNPNTGSVFLKTRLSDAVSPFLTGTLSVEDYATYTSLLVNTDRESKALDAPLGITVLKDDLSPPTEGNAKVRIIHLGVGAPDVDVYFFTGATQENPLITALSYGKVFPDNTPLSLVANGISAPVNAAFTNLPKGSYTYRIRATGADPTAEPLFTEGKITLAERRIYTIIVRGYQAPPAEIIGRNLSIQTILHERLAF